MLCAERGEEQRRVSIFFEVDRVAFHEAARGEHFRREPDMPHVVIVNGKPAMSGVAVIGIGFHVVILVWW